MRHGRVAEKWVAGLGLLQQLVSRRTGYGTRDDDEAAAEAGRSRAGVVCKGQRDASFGRGR
jgi:hypothetical protein